MLSIVHGLYLALVEVLFKTQPIEDSEENNGENGFDTVTVEDILDDDDESFYC